MIEISESKADKLKDYAYKSMKHLGKLYECIEELSEDSSMGERGSYGSRYGNRYGNRGGGSSSGGYGNRMGYREEEDFEEEEGYEQSYPMGMRRGVRGTGRYSRFR